MLNNLPYFLYMTEATRISHINAIINDFIEAANAGDDINDIGVQEHIFAKNNINMETLTEREKHEIARRVENLL